MGPHREAPQKSLSPPTTETGTPALVAFTSPACSVSSTQSRDSGSSDRSIVSLVSDQEGNLPTASRSGTTSSGNNPIKHDEGHIFIMVNNQKLIDYSQKLKADIVNNLHHTVRITKYRGRASAEDKDKFMKRKLSQGTLYAISIGLIHFAETRVDLFVLNGLSCVQEHRHVPWSLAFRLIEIVSDGIKHPVPTVGTLPAHEDVLLQYIGIDGYKEHAPGKVKIVIPPGYEPIVSVDLRSRGTRASTVEISSGSDSEGGSNHPPGHEEINSLDSDGIQSKAGLQVVQNTINLSATKPTTLRLSETIDIVLKVTSSEDESDGQKKGMSTGKKASNNTKRTKTDDINVKLEKNLKISETVETTTKESDVEEGEIKSSSSWESISGKDLEKRMPRARSSRSHSRHKQRKSSRGPRPRRLLSMPQLRKKSDPESDPEEQNRKLANRLKRFKSPTRKKDQKPSVSGTHRSRHREGLTPRRHSRRWSHGHSSNHRHRVRQVSSSSTSESESESSDRAPRLGRYEFNSR